MLSPKIAVLKSSSKPDERRIPIHPEHLSSIDYEIRQHLHFEEGYSEDFYYYPDEFYRRLSCHVAPRKELLESADASIILRPDAQDLLSMRDHSCSLGWFHCVQNKEMTDAAIQQKLTLVDLEKITLGNQSAFRVNSYNTGKQAVLYPLNLMDMTSRTEKKVIIFGYSAVSIGAIKQLHHLGFNQIICCTRRDIESVENKLDNVHYRQIRCIKNTAFVETIDGTPIIELLKEADIIINAIGQNIYNPMLFLQKKQLSYLKKNVLIIDASCDKIGMGFDFSMNTSIRNPIAYIQQTACCSIDHFPTIDYMNASKNISHRIVELLPKWLDIILENKFVSPFSEAIVINRGVIVDEDIHYFKQHLAQVLESA